MIITDLQCEQATNLSEVIDIVGEAFQSTDTSTVSKTYIDCPSGDFRAMPVRIGDVAGVKWVSVFPENSQQNLPTVLATIILNSATTGELLAILEATHITKLRTAAAAGVATNLLSNIDGIPRKGQIAAFIGCGAQTQLHVDAICSVRPSIAEVRFFDLNTEVCDLMCSANEGKFHLNNRPELWHGSKACKSIEECVDGADIVTTLTPSTAPIVKAKWLKKGVHINAMGADAEGKREFDSQTYKAVDIWVVDDFEQAVHSGETQHAYHPPSSNSGKMACMPWGKRSGKTFCNLAECLGRTRENQITLFDSTGLAIQDIAVANYIYEKLKEQ
jgi:alanine dehydrogenase